MIRWSHVAVLLSAMLLLSYAENGYGRLAQQKPLLFGRRGMNPNMNSLFFGKRSDVPSSYDPDEEICSLCKMVEPTCNVCLKENLLALADEK